MATTQNEHNGDGSDRRFSFTFPYIKEDDVKVSLRTSTADVTTIASTEYTFPSATEIQFNALGGAATTFQETTGAPKTGVTIRIFRDTDLETQRVTFFPGSSIRAQDLNDNTLQNLYASQERQDRAVDSTGGALTGNLTLNNADIVFEGATADDFETTLTVVDPTADRTLTLPNVTGTVITTGDTGTVNSTILGSSAVTSAKIAGDAVDGSKIADNSIDSEHYVDGSIDRVHLAADIVDGTKIADNSIDSEHYVDGSVDLAHMSANSVDSDQYVDGSIDRVHLAADIVDGTKLADNAVDSEHYTDGSIDRVHLAADIVDGTKIADDSIDSEHIANGAIDGVHLAADIVDGTKIADDSIDSEHYVDQSIDAAHLATNAVTTAKINADAVTNAKLANNAVQKENINGLTAEITDLNQIDGKTLVTSATWTSDTQFPSAANIDARITSRIDPIDGFVAIADEDSFPATAPPEGTAVSISNAGGMVIGASASTTDASRAGSDDLVTIQNIPANMQSQTVQDGIGMIVIATSIAHTYDFHRVIATNADVIALSGDINDFNNRYRVGSSNPTSDNDEGDLFYNTGSDKMLVWDGSEWDEVQSIGEYFIIPDSDFPTWNNTLNDISITSNAPANAEQIILSINGVIQEPKSGTARPSEGFSLNGSTIQLSAAPATGSDAWGVIIGSTVNIGTPSAGTVTDAKVATDAAIAGTKISPDFGSQDIVTTGHIQAGGGNGPNEGFQLPDGDGTARPRITNDGDNATVIRPGSATGGVKFNNFANSAELIEIDNNGRIKIGNDANYSAATGSKLAVELMGTAGTILEIADQTAGFSTLESVKNAGGGATDYGGYIFKGRRDADDDAKEYFRVDSAGNVGIGKSTNLFYRLTFQEGDNDASRIGWVSTSGNRKASIDCANTSAIRFNLGTSDAEKMRITSAGNVGIGTTAPGSLLELNAAAATVMGISLGDVGDSITASRYIGICNASDHTNISANSGFSGIEFGGPNSTNEGYLAFHTHDSGVASGERMRVSKDGSFLIGTTTSPSASSTGGSGFVADTDGRKVLELRNNAQSSLAQVRFFTNTGAAGSIVSGFTTTSYNTSSDYRLKEDIQPVVGASDRLMALKPVNFAWKASGERVDGFLAHEAQTVVPECVTGEKDAVDAEGNPEYQGIDQSKLVPLLTAALQEAIIKIETLETKVAALEGGE